MNRLLIVQRAHVGIDFEKDVEEAIGWEVHPGRLLADLAQRWPARRFAQVHRPNAGLLPVRSIWSIPVAIVSAPAVATHTRIRAMDGRGTIERDVAAPEPGMSIVTLAPDGKLSLPIPG